MSETYPSRLNLLSSQSASSSASIIFTQISSNFSTYYLKIRKLVPATDATALYVQFSTDGGSTWITTTTYNVTTQAINSAGNNTSDRNISATESMICNQMSNATTEPTYCDLVFYNLNQSTYHPKFISESMGTHWDSLGNVTYATGINTTTTAITAVKIYTSSGNIASGEFYFYGCTEGGLLY